MTLIAIEQARPALPRKRFRAQNVRPFTDREQCISDEVDRVEPAIGSIHFYSLERATFTSDAGGTVIFERQAEHQAYALTFDVPDMVDKVVGHVLAKGHGSEARTVRSQTAVGPLIIHHGIKAIRDHAGGDSEFVGNYRRVL